MAAAQTSSDNSARSPLRLSTSKKTSAMAAGPLRSVSGPITDASSLLTPN